MDVAALEDIGVVALLLIEVAAAVPAAVEGRELMGKECGVGVVSVCVCVGCCLCCSDGVWWMWMWILDNWRMERRIPKRAESVLVLMEGKKSPTKEGEDPQNGF